MLHWMWDTHITLDVGHTYYTGYTHILHWMYYSLTILNVLQPYCTVTVPYIYGLKMKIWRRSTEH